MISVLNTKLLIIIIALLASVVSYLAYEKHQQTVQQRKHDQMFEQMRKAGQEQKPQQWGDSLKKK